MNYTDLQEEVKNAMRAQDKLRLSILRQWHGELKNIEVNERREITEKDMMDMLRRLIKQTGETFQASKKAGTDTLRTENLGAQLEMLEGYLPEQLTGHSLVNLIEETIEKLGATSKKDMGKVMGAITKATGGNFDKAAAAKIISDTLS